jgi:nucleotide-binding universal stress UspA family protein
MNPFTIQKILVPIDLSHTSLKALDTAVAIASKHNATLQLLNIIEPAFDVVAEENDSSITHLSNSSDVLTALAGTIQYANKLKLKIIQAEGNVAENIIKHSFLHQCDLIIMGTHGASGYRDGFIGGNTYRVIKHSACPVLTVPPGGTYSSFKKVLFPIRPVSGALVRYDVVCHFLSSQSSMDVLGLSYNKINPETNVLEKIIEEVKEDLEMDKVKAKPVWGEGRSVAEDVLHYKQQTHPDLLVVTPVLDAIIKPGFIGPHTQKIINCSRAPVLSIKKIGIPVFP